ncbi:MAG: DUF2877 domain-containing protein [Clostridiaceae bacterium]|jgi:hypothetical protein|nr:DUF2877 domain-containing protein [Clostridiaceae bacterium]
MMAGHEYKSLMLAADLRQFLLERPQLELQVHSVFETSINLMAEEELITLAVSSRELMPMGLIVDTAELEQWQLKAGDIVLYSHKAFQLPQGIRILLEKAEVRKLSLSEALKSKNCIDKASLEIVRSKLLASEGGGISDLAALLPESKPIDRPLNIYAKYIKEDLFSFLQALRKRDYAAAVSLADRLIGFGPGLTPSADDFLTGIILFFYYKDGESSFFQEIVELASRRTTVLSYHMVKNAAAGKAYESYLTLIRILAGEDQKSLEALADRVLSYGASSGADFLFGVYCAGLICYESENIRQATQELAAINRCYK